jgi:multisubunit Na+/H+ antiporter MnhC subunit
MPNQLNPRFFMSWIGLATLTFLLMLTHQSDPATILGRYSLSYTALLGVVLGTLIVAGMGYVFSQRKPIRVPTLNRLPMVLLSIVLGMLSIVGIWLLPLTRFQNAIAVFSLYLAILVFMGIFVLLRYSATPARWLTFAMMGSALVVVVIAVLYFVDKVPPLVYFDEDYIALWASSWAKTNTPHTILYHPLRTDLAIVTNSFLYPLGVWLNTVGISDFTARLGSALIALLSIPFLWDVLRRTYGYTVAFWASIIGILLMSQVFVRSDSGVALCVAVAIWLMSFTDKRPYVWILVGFALAFAIEGHQLGVRFGLAYGLWLVGFTLYQGWKHQQWQFLPVIYLGMGAVLCAGFYLALRLLWIQSDLSEFIRLTQQAFELENQIAGSADFFTRFTSGLLGWLNGLLVSYPLAVLVIGTGTLLAFRYNPIRREVIVFWLSVLLYLLLNPKTSAQYYYIHHAPFIILIGAGILGYLVSATGKSWLSSAWAGLALALVLINFTVIARDTGAREVVDIGHAIDDLLPAEVEPVVGWGVYYWALNARIYYYSSSFYENPVALLNNQYNQPLPQAIIITTIDDVRPYLREFIADNNFRRVQCYFSPKFGWTVEVFVRPDILPDMQDNACSR